MFTNKLLRTHGTERSRPRHFLFRGSSIIGVHFQFNISKFKSVGFDQYSKYALKRFLYLCNFIKTLIIYINPNFNRSKWKKSSGLLMRTQFFKFLDSTGKCQDGVILPKLLPLNFKSKTEMEKFVAKGNPFFYQRYQEVFESHS